MREPLKKRLPYYLPLVAIAVVAVFFTSIKVWFGDAISYSFFHASGFNGFTGERVSSLSDIWESQINHYHFTNGRFVCHYLVQLFCGLLPRGWFDVFNELAWIWLMVAVARLAGVTPKYPGRMAALASLMLLAYQTLPFDPPHQMNYVWGAAVNATFILVFFTRKKLSVTMLMLSALLGFIAGEWNESFSMPIALTVLVYVCRHRLRITPVQWVSGLTYAIGTLVLCLAPAVLVRIGVVSSAESSILNRLEEIAPSLLFPGIYLCMQPWRRENRGRASYTVPAGFLILVAVSGYIVSAAIAFTSGPRMLLCATTMLIALIVRSAHIRQHTGATVTALLCVLAVAATSLQYTREKPIVEKYSRLKQLYHDSEDGLVILPDRIYIPGYREANTTRMTLTLEERSQNPAKPPLRIYPESLTRINLQKDTNMCVPFVEQGWILIQSRSHPADFEIEKVLLPGLLDKKMTPRKVDFSPQSDILIDSTSAVRVAVYINERPYIQSGISLKQ